MPQIIQYIINELPLNIIGDGDEYDNISRWIEVNGFTLVGPLFDQKRLEPYFGKADACISLGQAGLSVLTSMDYGTPFVTIRSAITEGKIFNVHHDETDILYDMIPQLN